jgi:hypothetical protein|eukprot:COSAG01_NODE_316_length_19004_cov_100.001322_7_plen_94_part_00
MQARALKCRHLGGGAGQVSAAISWGRRQRRNDLSGSFPSTLSMTVFGWNSRALRSLHAVHSAAGAQPPSHPASRCCVLPLTPGNLERSGWVGG